MAFFRSSNPTLQEKIFQNTIMVPGEETMTRGGALNKFFFLFLMVMASASFTWSAFYNNKYIVPWVIGSAIAAFILAFAITFKPQRATYLAPAYGLLKGVVIGGISAMYNNAFIKVAPGIVMQAVGLTFGVVIAMYLLYKFQLIKATEKLRAIVFTATVGIAIFYVIAIVLRMVGISMSFIHEGTNIGILFSLVVVVIAAMNLIFDFDMIDQGAAMGAPKYMEWYCAFGLLVTIVWLYLEILRLLSKLASRK